MCNELIHCVMNYRYYDNIVLVDCNAVNATFNSVKTTYSAVMLLWQLFTITVLLVVFLL